MDTEHPGYIGSTQDLPEDALSDLLLVVFETR